MANRTVAVDLVANVGQYQSAMVRAASTTKAVGDTATSAGTKAQRGFDMAGRGATLLGGALAGGVALGLKRTIDLAANAEQSVGGVEAVFKSYAQSVLASSQAADRALGLSANSYRELATVIGSQLKNAGVPMEQLAAQTDDLITMGADLAAMFGGTTEEAVRALSSALKGEMDPIEAYGISLNDAALKAEAAALGLDVMGGSLTTNQRAMAVMSLVTKQGADAVGAFGREQDTAAGRAARAAAQWENLQTAIGEKLLPVWSGLMDFIGETVIPGLETVGGAVSDIVGLFTDLPGPVQATVAAIGALVVFRGPLAAMLTGLQVNAVLGAAGLLEIVLNADRAKGAIAGLVSAGAGLATVFVLAKAVNDIVQFTEAGDDARETIEAISDSLEDLEGPAKIDATKTAIEQLKKELAESKAILDEYAAYNGFEWAIWGQFVMDADEVANAKDEVRLYEEAIARLQQESLEAAGAVPLVGEAITLVGQQAQVSQDLWQEWLDKVAESNGTFAGALSIYQGLLDQKTEMERVQAQAAADATTDASDSWEDHVDSVEVSLGELATALQTSIDNQMNWRTNLGQIAQWAGQDVANYLMEMGEEGVDIVARMADGTSAEARSMRDQIVRQIRLMGEESTGDFANYMRIMETMGSEGGKRTVQGLAAQLGLGVDAVRRIAAQYGLNLAEGVNPLLAALGKPRVVPAINGQRQYFYADGGYTGDGGKWEPAGIVHKGEYVVTKERTARLGVRNLENLERIMPGYADGGFVSGSSVPRPPSTAPYGKPISTAGDATMGRAYGDTVDWVNANSAPPIASGSPGQWQAMFAAVQRQFPGVVLHSGFRPGSITATGNLSYHASGRAIDITPSMDIFNWLASNYRNSRELIFSPAGTRQIWNGQPHYYSEPTRGDHWDHIHWAMQNGGVIGEPVVGRGQWSGGLYSFAEQGPETVQPGVRSREFSGSVAYGGSGGAVVVKIDGARIVGTLMVNGLEAQMDGRIVQAISSVNSQLASAGVR